MQGAGAVDLVATPSHHMYIRSAMQPTFSRLHNKRARLLMPLLFLLLLFLYVRSLVLPLRIVGVVEEEAIHEEEGPLQTKDKTPLSYDAVPTTKPDDSSNVVVLNIEEKVKPGPESSSTSVTSQKNNENANIPPTVIFDMISIGSLRRPDIQASQARTFGSHKTVRNFFPITELNDTDSTCYETLTDAQVATAVAFCQNTNTSQSDTSTLFRAKLQIYNKKSPGWLCAQKRPIDGLRLVLERYKVETLPDYLIVMDDDSYFDMKSLLNMLLNDKRYAPDKLALLGGCIYTFPRWFNFAFPYGGFGSILTRKTIENLVRPIYCDEKLNPDPDGFTRLACWRLAQNLVGEKEFFREGMSVGDLMYEYSSGLPFSRVDQWKNGLGYCFHSDHALGYFFGFYHVVAPSSVIDKAEASDELRLKNVFSYTTITLGKQCNNERLKCNSNSTICHYVNPEQMDALYATIRDEM